MNQNFGNEKGPDSQAELFRQMLAQHMVRPFLFKKKVYIGISR